MRFFYTTSDRDRRVPPMTRKERRVMQNFCNVHDESRGRHQTRTSKAKLFSLVVAGALIVVYFFVMFRQQGR